MRLRWGIACILLMAACTRPDNDLVETRHGTSQIKQVPEPVEGPSPKLQAIDSLIWRQPDSALAVLMDYLSDDGRDGVHTVSTNETFNNHYTQLLVSELLYKNDYKQTNREDLLQAVSYFDSLTLALGDRPHAFWRHCGLDPQSPKPNDDVVFLDARAHYINGVGYYEKDSVVEACKEYLKALEVMEEHYKEKELVGNKSLFMAYTYTRLTDLFSDLYLHEQAIYFAKISLTYYKKQDSPSWYQAWVLNKIGSHYDMMDELDSAYQYYHKASVAINDTTIILYRDIATHQVYLKYRTNDQKDIALNELHHLLSEAENEKEYCSRCAIIGEIYYYEKQFDSAWIYLNKVYNQTQNTEAKRQAAEWLVEICKAQGNDVESHEFAIFLVPFANQEENSSGLKSQLTKLYDVFKDKTHEKQHHKETMKHTKRVLVIMGGMLAMLLAVFFFYCKNKRGKRKLEVQMETERHAHKMQQAALSGRLKRSNAALKEKEEKRYDDKAPKQNHFRQAENYLEEPICRRILSICNDENNPIKSSVPVSSYANITLTDAQKAELKKAALAHYAPLFEKLRLQHPELKEKDYMYCYLCLLGLDNAQIAVMTQLSYRTVWEREKRLQHVFHKEERIAIILNELMTN